MPKQRTLVVLTPGFPEDETDTVCLPLQQSLVKCLQEKFQTLRVLILSFQYPYSIKTYQWFGMNVTTFNGRNRGGWQRYLTRRKIASRLEAIHRENEIIGLLSFWYGECAYVGNRFSKKHGIAHYCWILGQDAKNTNPYPVKVRLPAKNLVALSDFIADEFERNHTIRPQHIVPPGIDPREFPGVQPLRDIAVLGAGSLIPLKQFDLLVRVIAALHDQLPEFHAVLAGDGPARGELNALINERGLSSIIRLTGEVSHPEVLALMQRARLFLHPSAYEGFGVVCLEALYAGASVISFVKPMRQEILNWYVVTNEQEMIEKARSLLQDSPISQTSVHPYSMTECVRAFAELFGIK